MGLLPAVAALGAAWASVSLVRVVIRLARRERVPFVVLGLRVLAAVLLVVIPGSHLVRALTSTRDGGPPILAGFGDWFGAEGYPRPSAHRGLDLRARVGTEVLAAADGEVTVARDNRDLCGLIVVIDHPPAVHRTVYCHFGVIAVRVGDRVARGQPIGTVGTSGQRAFPGFEHVHLELQRGRDPRDIEDPRPYLVGCFDAARAYPRDRLSLTYPVRCRALPRRRGRPRR